MPAASADVITHELTQALALELDRAALRGSGTAPEPRGLRNQMFELARRFDVVEAAYDPWRWRSEALRAEQQGLRVVEFPQSHARMTVASEGLHAAVVEKRLQHPGDRDLNSHVAAAVARATGRGWRLDKSAHDAQIDAVVALAMAVERAEHREPATKVLGWL